DGAAMEQHFAAATQSHAAWRADHREGCVFEACVYLLAVALHEPHGEPGAQFLGDEEETDIGADGEIFALIVDDQAAVAAGNEANRLVDQTQRQRIERIHLAVKLKTQDTVANVPQAGGAVAGNRLRAQLDVSEEQHADGVRQVAIAAGHVKELPSAVLRTVEASPLGHLQ